MRFYECALESRISGWTASVPGSVPAVLGIWALRTVYK